MNDREKTAKMIVDAIVRDFTDRRGLRQEWDALDSDIKREIKRAWEASTVKILEGRDFT